MTSSRLYTMGAVLLAAAAALIIVGAFPLTHHRSGTNSDGSGWSSKMHEHAGGVDLVQASYAAALVLALGATVLVVAARRRSAR